MSCGRAYHGSWYIWLVDGDTVLHTAAAMLDEFVDVGLSESYRAAQFDTRQDRMIASAGMRQHPGDAHVQLLCDFARRQQIRHRFFVFILVSRYRQHRLSRRTNPTICGFTFSPQSRSPTHSRQPARAVPVDKSWHAGWEVHAGNHGHGAARPLLAMPLNLMLVHPPAWPLPFDP